MDQNSSDENIEDLPFYREHFDKLTDYDEMVIKVPKATGVKERYTSKDGLDILVNPEFKNSRYIDPKTGEPAHNKIYKKYYSNGQLFKEGLLINGKIQGRTYTYNTNGTLSWAGNLVRNKAIPYGLKFNYSHEGHLMSIEYINTYRGKDFPLIDYIFRFNPQGEIIYENF